MRVGAARARRRAGAALALLALLTGAAAAWRWGRPAALTLGLASPLVGAWLAPGAPDPAVEVTLAAGHTRTPADLYLARPSQGALVLVHGLSRHGRRHPELVRLAQLLARHGQSALVPELPGLAAFRLRGDEAALVAAGARALAERGLGPVGVLGFSFGAGPALLAAEDIPGLRVAVAVGGYADPRHVLGFLTTGVHAHGGRRVAQRAEPYNRWKALALLADVAPDPADANRLAALARRWLADPGDAAAARDPDLGAGGQAVLRLVVNRDPEAIEGLLAGLPASARDALDRLSTTRAAARLGARLVLIHGADDDSIPYTESLRLADATGGRAHLALLATFHHTGPGAPRGSSLERLRDAWRLFRAIDTVLDAR